MGKRTEAKVKDFIFKIQSKSEIKIEGTILVSAQTKSKAALKLKKTMPNFKIVSVKT
jgi:hypothetical protein